MLSLSPSLTFRITFDCSSVSPYLPVMFSSQLTLNFPNFPSVGNVFPVSPPLLPHSSQHDLLSAPSSFRVIVESTTFTSVSKASSVCIFHLYLHIPLNMIRFPAPSTPFPPSTLPSSSSPTSSLINIFTLPHLHSPHYGQLRYSFLPLFYPFRLYLCLFHISLALTSSLPLEVRRGSSQPLRISSSFSSPSPKRDQQ